MLLLSVSHQIVHAMEHPDDQHLSSVQESTGNVGLKTQGHHSTYSGTKWKSSPGDMSPSKIITQTPGGEPVPSTLDSTKHVPVRAGVDANYRPSIGAR